MPDKPTKHLILDLITGFACLAAVALAIYIRNDPTGGVTDLLGLLGVGVLYQGYTRRVFAQYKGGNN